MAVAFIFIAYKQAYRTLVTSLEKFVWSPGRKFDPLSLSKHPVAINQLKYPHAQHQMHNI